MYSCIIALRSAGVFADIIFCCISAHVALMSAPDMLVPAVEAPTAVLSVCRCDCPVAQAPKVAITSIAASEDSK